MSPAEAFAIIRAAWPANTIPATPFAVQYAGAWAKVESGWGTRWTGEMASSHNWGSVHCSHGPPCGDDCTQHDDHHADGRAYSTCFKRYRDDLEGAGDFLNQLIVKRPLTRAALARGESVADVVAAMRHEHYFGGFCPKASADGAGQNDPACEAEVIENSTATLRSIARQNAAAAGEPDALAGASSRSSGLGLALGIVLAGGATYLATRRRA